MKLLILVTLFVFVQCEDAPLESSTGQNENLPKESSNDQEKPAEKDINSDPQRKIGPFEAHTPGHGRLFGCGYISEIINEGNFNWEANYDVKATATPLLTPRTNKNYELTERKAVDHLLDYNDLVQARNFHIPLPQHYDARSKHSYCKNSLLRIDDQGCNCKASWAAAPTSALADRFCIKTRGGFQESLSIEKVLTCCNYCTQGKGCEGGFSTWAWVYLKQSGTVTGGPYNSSEGCLNYQVPPCGLSYDSFTPKCKQYCDFHRNPFNVYTTLKSYAHKNTTVRAIQEDIYENGPVTTDIKVYEDFYCYRRGIYNHVLGEQLTTLTVKLIGWGEEGGEKYWLAANTWGTRWGEEGFFKIRRGDNECNVEYFITAGMPFMENPVIY